MSIKLLAGVAVIAAGVGLSGSAPVHAAPTNPLSPCSDCLPGPGGGPGGHSIGIPATPIQLPMTGGGPKSGGPSVTHPRHDTAKPIGH
jgi:hypothetical protein